MSDILEANTQWHTIRVPRKFAQKNAKKIFHLLQCSDALQSSPLTEAAELLDLLNHIEFEGLLFAHDKLAERQVQKY